jgi:hypothetical protein
VVTGQFFGIVSQQAMGELHQVATLKLGFCLHPAPMAMRITRRMMMKANNWAIF